MAIWWYNNYMTVYTLVYVCGDLNQTVSFLSSILSPILSSLSIYIYILSLRPNHSVRFFSHLYPLFYPLFSLLLYLLSYLLSISLFLYPSISESISLFLFFPISYLLSISLSLSYLYIRINQLVSFLSCILFYPIFSLSIYLSHNLILIS